MNSPARVILPISTVLDRVPYGRTTVWKKSNDPEDPFPATVDVGPNRTGIFEDELNAWLDSLPRRGASPAMADDDVPDDDANNALIEDGENKPADEARADADRTHPDRKTIAERDAAT